MSRKQKTTEICFIYPIISCLLSFDWIQVDEQGKASVFKPSLAVAC